MCTASKSTAKGRHPTFMSALSVHMSKDFPDTVFQPDQMTSLCFCLRLRAHTHKIPKVSEGALQHNIFQLKVIAIALVQYAIELLSVKAMKHQLRPHAPWNHCRSSGLDRYRAATHYVQCQNLAQRTSQCNHHRRNSVAQQ